MILDNGSCVHIVGAGPAGSFFAVHLIRQARQVRKKLNIFIIDGKATGQPGVPGYGLKGCNFCAGVISPVLYREMAGHQLRLPEDVVCQDFSHIWIHGRWKNFPLKVPPKERLVSVFRGALPQGRGPFPQGLDAFLLSRAIKEGAGFIAGTATDIRYDQYGKPVLSVEQPGKPVQQFESDFVCIAAGVNAVTGKKDTRNFLYKSFGRINPAFRLPKTRPALIFELKPGRSYLKKYMNREVYLMIADTAGLRLEHGALVPKGDYMTVSLVGKSIDDLSSGEETAEVIRRFMSLSQFQAILPGINYETTPVCCRCTPRMAAGIARSPFADRIALTGDAFGARLYRDGLYSSFIGGRTLAETVVNQGVDKGTLTRSLAGLSGWLKSDNFYCRLVFGIVQRMLKSRVLSRMMYQSFASEMKFRTTKSWPMGRILWRIGSGTADYRHVLKGMFSLPVLFSFLKGAWRTTRNVFTEMFFGLKWGEYGRYPTVILKEKRKFIKKSIQTPLGTQLREAPEMERMYAVKIRASSQTIFQELGRFGDPSARFLKLRFVDVKRIKGEPNLKGSVVRYALCGFPISMDILLVRSIKNRSLLYEPQELFTKKGVLLFDITPTRDGNNRLVVYTAFDFRTGSTIPGRLFFKVFKYFFPDYAHDVVWNHAMCTIKACAERIEKVTPALQKS